MKDWFDKKAQYEDLYRQGRTAKNLWRYIPEKFCEGIIDAFSNYDGYWIYLDHESGGWVSYDGGEDTGTICVYTIADLKAAVKTIRKVNK